MQSVGQKKTKTFREHCNAAITRVLNTSGANYKINLNLIYRVGIRLPDDPLRWNFSRKFPTRDLS